MARISLMLAEAHSLKEKRMVLRRIKDRVRDRLGVFVSEVGSPESKDAWQRSELGVAIASGDRQKALALIDDVIRVAMSAGGAEITAIAKDAITFQGEPSLVEMSAFDASDASGALGPEARPLGHERTGSGDKLVGGDDWVPAAWREESES
jgi:uncharacterized protein YlxP (DUF503 family)